ncbi:MAG: hypothetical protein KKF44_08095 [Nanoarchaeota archaeon]|nr:hypothetical protein [Nanoarchaeota archaeon]
MKEKSKIDFQIEDLLLKLNVEFAQFRLNMLRKPENKRKLAASLKLMHKTIGLVNKNFPKINTKPKK